MRTSDRCSEVGGSISSWAHWQNTWLASSFLPPATHLPQLGLDIPRLADVIDGVGTSSPEHHQLQEGVCSQSVSTMHRGTGSLSCGTEPGNKVVPPGWIILYHLVCVRVCVCVCVCVRAWYYDAITMSSHCWQPASKAENKKRILLNSSLSHSLPLENSNQISQMPVMTIFGSNPPQFNPLTFPLLPSHLRDTVTAQAPLQSVRSWF